MLLSDTARASREARIEFALPGAPGRAYNAAAPGLRAATVALDAQQRPAGQVQLIRFGPFTLDDRCPQELGVRGGIVPGPMEWLGTLVRRQGEAVVFLRHFPRAEQASGHARILTAASAERIAGNRFLLKVGYFNCGHRFTKDLSAFVHFEFEPQGEHLHEPCRHKLFPRSMAVDSATWRPDEVTVVTFGVFEFPPGAPKCVYVRAGLYDQHGTGERVPMAGSDDGTGRVRVGRFVRRSGRVWFDRLPGETP